MASTIYDYRVKDHKGQELPLAQFKGQVVLIVNTASRCGFTPQYDELEKLYRQHKDKGFVVLAFPCNQFKEQEPGNNEEIVQFCKTTYDVTFPIMDKIEVNGSNTAPLYGFLKSSKPGILGSEAIKWNFTKFLIDKKGVVVKRYAPQTTPLSIEADVLDVINN